MNTQTSFSSKTLEQLRNWGGPREMTAFEAMMWLAEADPHLRSTTTSVMVLDTAPDWNRLVAGHEWTTRAAPRLRQKVMVPAFGADLPVWVDDPEFILDYHLRRVRLPEPGTERQLLDFAQTLAMTPFDRCRPPWEAVLVEGLENNSAAYILKLHHAVSDGIGIMQLMTEALNASRNGRSFPELKAKRAPRATSTLELSAKNALGRVLDLPKNASASLSSLMDAATGWLNKDDPLREAFDYLASAKRMLATKPATGSPILKKRSLGTRFDVIEVPLSDFKAAAKGVNASLNDVFLAGLIGGFRSYHEQMGVKLDRMPIGFPISLRNESDTAGGNKFAGVQYPAPISERDPLKRIAHIQHFVRNVRTEPALDVVLKIAPVMVQLPTAVLTSIAANMTAAQDAQISNVPGIVQPLHMAGAHVTHLWPFAPTVGCGMMIAMVSHNGRCCIGINSDRAAVTEPELLTNCLREGIEEVLALRSLAKPAVARRPAKTATKPVVKPAAKAVAEESVAVVRSKPATTRKRVVGPTKELGVKAKQ
jgi:diacylglycerol O-acyltransferase / wax synthase